MTSGRREQRLGNRLSAGPSQWSVQGLTSAGCIKMSQCLMTVSIPRLQPRGSDSEGPGRAWESVL